MVDWLAHRARVSPEKLAIIDADLPPHGGAARQEWNYARLDLETGVLAARLRAAGVKSGDHLAVLLPNSAEYILAIHAAARLGAVLVLLNTRLTVDEFGSQVSDVGTHQAGVTWILSGREMLGTASTVSANSASRVRLLDVQELLGGLDEIDQVEPISGNVPSLSELEAVQTILFTSGTTGKPQGAMLTYANHYWSAMASATRLGLDLEDRWLLCMPLYHVGGLAIVLRSCLYGTTIVLQRKFMADQVLENLLTHQITLVSLVPTMFSRVMALDRSGEAFRKVRWVLLGGAAAPSELLEEATHRNIPVAVTYGMTETASQVATGLYPRETLADRDHSLSTPPNEAACWVGKPLMFTQVRVMLDQGVERSLAEPGEVGEIQVKGPTVMPGYLSSGEESSKRGFGPEDWFSTGDLGTLDEAGDLWVIQRRVDLILTGGENVYPVEVERVLERHPAIRSACVVGISDQDWGQQVAAAVVLRKVTDSLDTTVNEIFAFCRGHLAGYKVPRMILPVTELPMTPSGKILRQEVRVTLSEYLRQNPLQSHKVSKGHYTREKYDSYGS